MERTLVIARSDVKDWTRDARFYEYTSAANPVLPKVPFASIDPGKDSTDTMVYAFDLSDRLETTCPASTPNLLASFIRIKAGDSLPTREEASSQLFYVLRGSGNSESEHGKMMWNQDDLFVLPKTGALTHTAKTDALIYWVHDGPLMHYLGVIPKENRFLPTLYRAGKMRAELDKIANEAGAEKRNRRGILLGNAATPQTMTVTHTLWSLLNVLPAKSVQRPHRHNSVALDLCIDAAPGTYTMIGSKMDASGTIVDGHRANWVPGAAFVTPPGLWHSHHNESDQDAIVLPVQDAGLLTYQRLLGIEFA